MKKKMNCGRNMEPYIKTYLITNAIDKGINECVSKEKYISTLKPSIAIPLIDLHLSDRLFDEIIMGKILSLDKQLDSSDTLPLEEYIL